MIALAIIAFLFGAYIATGLTRRKYEKKILTIKNDHIVKMTEQHLHSYRVGYVNGMADEFDAQQRMIDTTFLIHAV